MPQTFSLACYSIKVQSREDREWEQVSNFGDGSDLYSFFDSFFSGLKAQASDNKSAQQLIRVQQMTKDPGDRRLYGKVETGEYGTESELVDVETGKLAHRRKRTEADMWPFYFLVDIPDGTDEAFLILQRSGNYGIRQFLYEMFVTKFDIEHDDFKLHIQPMVESKDIEKYQKGRIEALRFIRYHLPKDITDAFDKGHKEKLGRVELVVYARRKYSVPIGDRLKEFLTRKSPPSKFVSLIENKFEYDEVKLASRVGRARRTLDLSDMSKLRSYHDISDIVDIDDVTGHPEFESIHNEAESLLKRIKNQIYKT